MTMEELLVTLKMLEMEYFYINKNKKEYLEIRKNIQTEEMQLIIKILNDNNIKYNYITFNGQLRGVYIFNELV